MNARRTLLLALVVVVPVLVTACGGSPASHVSTDQNAAALAFSTCMRSHGVPSFPDPDAQGNFPTFNTGVSKQASATANETCKHLLSRGGSTGTPQQRRQKFAFALKVAACLRRNGFPEFPDPTSAGQHVPPRIDTNSPGFQAAEGRCEQRARKALGLP